MLQLNEEWVEQISKLMMRHLLTVGWFTLFQLVAQHTYDSEFFHVFDSCHFDTTAVRLLSCHNVTAILSLAAPVVFI